MKFQTELQKQFHIDYCNGSLRIAAKSVIINRLIEAFPDYTEFPFHGKTTHKTLLQLVVAVLEGNCYNDSPYRLNGLLRKVGNDAVIVVKYSYTFDYLVFGKKGFFNIKSLN